jgi:hypothetical protein
MASAHSADRSNTATPMMLWPEARRSPRVGIVGATPTPSADIHATARPAARVVEAVQKAQAALERELRQRPCRRSSTRG